MRIGWKTSKKFDWSFLKNLSTIWLSSIWNGYSFFSPLWKYQLNKAIELESINSLKILIWEAGSARCSRTSRQIIVSNLDICASLIVLQKVSFFSTPNSLALNSTKFLFVWLMSTKKEAVKKETKPKSEKSPN